MGNRCARSELQKRIKTGRIGYPVTESESIIEKVQKMAVSVRTRLRWLTISWAVEDLSTRFPLHLH